jgi:hypothetical protein
MLHIFSQKAKKYSFQPQWLKRFCGMEVFSGCQTSERINLFIFIQILQNIIDNKLSLWYYYPPLDKQKKKNAREPPLNRQFAGFVVCHKNIA